MSTQETVVEYPNTAERRIPLAVILVMMVFLFWVVIPLGVSEAGADMPRVLFAMLAVAPFVIVGGGFCWGRFWALRPNNEYANAVRCVFLGNSSLVVPRRQDFALVARYGAALIPLSWVLGVRLSRESWDSSWRRMLQEEAVERIKYFLRVLRDTEEDSRFAVVANELAEYLQVREQRNVFDVVSRALTEILAEGNCQNEWETVQVRIIFLLFKDRDRKAWLDAKQTFATGMSNLLLGARGLFHRSTGKEE